MPFGTRCGFLILMLGALVGAAPALAQEETPAKASPSGTWTDPPVRGSAGPDAATAAKPSDATPARAGAASALPARAEAAVSKRSPRRAARRRTDRVREAARPPARVRPVRAEAEPAREARSVSRRGRRVETAAVERPRRSSRDRRHGRYYATAAAARLSVGRGMPAYGSGYAPGSRGWAEVDDDPADVRSVRFAGARPPAYRVMRLRTITFPDGRILQTLRPYDGDPEGEF